MSQVGFGQKEATQDSINLTIKTMAKFKLKGTINFTTRANHPDIKGYTGEYNDVYTFDSEMYDIESAKGFIKRNLKLVAGGGYRTDTIKNVTINIARL